MIPIAENPRREEWPALLTRPELDRENLKSSVRVIMDEVREKGDDAVLAFAKKYDGVAMNNFRVSEKEIKQAASQVPEELKKAIKTAYDNVYKFHLACQPQFSEGRITKIETTPGITCWRRSLPIEKVGLYIPGGTAPLFSTVLMLAIPARIAGCKEVVLCSPPDKSGDIHPAILYTASLCGVTQIFKTGGAQAIAAMGCGTESVPAVHKIFGPGNTWVTQAKELIQQEGVAIDMPAGPSEVLVIADVLADPAFVAADLLSQAEHGVDSHVVLACDDFAFAKAVNREVRSQIKTLPRQNIATKALENSQIIVLNDIETCVAASNFYAPEHLIINTKDADAVAEKITVAGSIFIGSYRSNSSRALE